MVPWGDVTLTAVGVTPVTVAVTDAVAPPDAAVIVALPAATAVTKPLESTVATALLLDDHVTIPPAGIVTAESCRVWPGLRVKLPEGEIVMVVWAVGRKTTV
jgi:hypothetical protein